MLYLAITIGRQRYAIPCRDIERVVPLARLRKIPKTPGYIAGLLNYRGEAVPVVDLCALLTNQPAQSRLDSRIILIRYSPDPESSRLLGLIAEQVTDTLDLSEKSAVAGGVHVPEVDYLGRFAALDGTLIQEMAPGKLLPPELRRLLFSETDVVA
jgi:chemotaxis-related protein WspB